jgi:hypothetical protein
MQKRSNFVARAARRKIYADEASAHVAETATIHRASQRLALHIENLHRVVIYASLERNNSTPG